MNFRNLLENKKGQLKQIEDQLKTEKEKLESLLSEKEDLESAQSIIMMVAQATQEELKFHIEELVSLAMASVYDDPYTLELDFQQRRNQTEVDLWFVRDGQRIEPLSASGGGAIDVAAFALRVSLWSLSPNRTRPVFILDEPFQHVKGNEANIKCIQMVKAVSERLKVQILMISDERVPLSEIEAGADKVFKVSITSGKSKVEELTTEG